MIFETGLLEVTIGDTGSTSLWFPTESLTPDRLAASRVPIPIGAPFSLSMGVQPGPGLAPERMTTMISTPVALAFRAEWQTGILDELATFEPDWVEVIETGGGEVPISDPLGQQIAEQNYRDWTDKPLLADCPPHQRDFIYKAFNRDSSIAAAMGSAFSLTPLFDQMVRRRGVVPVASGDQALSILVPNVGELPWEAVLEFREHPGCYEAREKLRGFEQRAAESEPLGALEYLRSISQQVSFAYAQALEEQRPKLGAGLASRPQEPPYRSCRPPGRSSKRRRPSRSSCALTRTPHLDRSDHAAAAPK